MEFSMGVDPVFKLLTHAERLQQLALKEDCTPLTIEIDPCAKCGHACIFCSSGDNKLQGEDLPEELVIELLHDLRERDVRSVVWKGGGEPTLSPLLGKYITLAHELGFSQGLTTNGSCLHRVEQPAAAFLSWNRISLDAATAETHYKIHRSRDFDHIIANISRYLALKPTGSLGLNMNIDVDNYLEIESFVLLGMRLGVSYVSMRTAYYECFGYENRLNETVAKLIQTKLDQVQKLDTGRMRVVIGQGANLGHIGALPAKCCLAPALRGIVTATGEVVACCDLRYEPGYSFGNLKEHSFWTIWDGPKRQEVFARTKKKECLSHCSFAFDYYGRAIDSLREGFPDEAFM
jgi:MoaA/NifB/PqqE/SkfB family radical SAM enzyme